MGFLHKLVKLSQGQFIPTAMDSLNLAASDALKGSKLMKDALETVHEISKLIKYSPRREGIFGIRVLCPEYVEYQP